MPDSSPHPEPVPIDELLQKYLPSLEAFMRLRAGAVIRARESCADLAQSVCREILTHRARMKYEGEVGFRKWLFTTARRKIADRHDYYKAAKRDFRQEAGQLDASASAVPDEELLAQYATFCTPSRHVAAREELHAVEDAFDELPEDHQEVILLAHVFGMNRREIGEAMGRTEEAVRALLYRALGKLSDVMARRKQ